MLDLLRRGEEGLDLARSCRDRARETGDFSTPVGEVLLAAPLPRPNSIRDFMLVEEHVRNSFGTVPAEWYRIPIHWKGNPDTVYGPDDVVPWPYYTDKLDFELEVAAVLGRPAHRVSADEARDCIAGYTIFNDWSARDIQLREMTVGLGPAYGKDFATSLGPALATRRRSTSPRRRMSARINGETWSSGSLGAMLYSYAEAISALSAEQPLQPGDVFGGAPSAAAAATSWTAGSAPGRRRARGHRIGVLRNTVGRKRPAPRIRHRPRPDDGLTPPPLLHVPARRPVDRLPAQPNGDAHDRSDPAGLHPRSVTSRKSLPGVPSAGTTTPTSGCWRAWSSW